MYGDAKELAIATIEPKKVSKVKKHTYKNHFKIDGIIQRVVYFYLRMYIPECDFLNKEEKEELVKNDK